MILKITKKNAPSPDSSSPNGRAPKSERSAGWDPFEVWRTRVLLPRLEGDQEQDKPAPTVQLVRK